MRVLAEKWKTPEHLAFGPGTQLAVAYSSGLVVWDAATGEQLARHRFLPSPDYPLRVGGVYFPPDGRAVYLIDGHTGLHAFRLPDPRPEPPVRLDPPRYYGSLAMSADGRRLVWHAHTGSGSELTGFRRDGGGGGPPEAVWSARLDRSGSALAFFPDGSRFAAARTGWGPGPSDGVEIRAWPGGDVLASAEHGRANVARVAVSPDGGRVALAAGPSVFVWPASLQGKPRQASDVGRHFVTDLAFHPANRFLVATANDARVRLYDAATLALARTFAWDIGKLKSVAFSADGQLAAAAGEGGRVVVWDVDL